MSLSQLPPDTLARWGVDPSWFTLPGQPTDQHLIPVSGGADSSALAILMHLMYPESKRPALPPVLPCRIC
jgi:hypothetical protein